MNPIPPKPSTAIILENKRKRKDGTSFLKLRVTFDRVCRFYTIYNESGKKVTIGDIAFANNEPFAMSSAVYKNIFSKTKQPQEEYLVARLIFENIRGKAVDLIKDLPDFSFEAFEKVYNQKNNISSGDEKDLLVWVERLAKDMREEGRISTAVTYECAHKSLSTFLGKETLLLKDFSPALLNRYEQWMEEKKNSSTTTGIYLRSVRVAYIKAMKKGFVATENYPFGKRSDEKFQIPSGTNIKKALTIKQVGLIANFKTIEHSNTERYRDYWFFCYLANGMNVKDMAKLKYKNIDHDKLTFIREKTRRETAANPKIITVVITPLVSRIIKKWGNLPAAPDTYIFPILENGATPERQYKLIQQATKMINFYIDAVATKLKIPQKVTTYVSRHSFATVLKRSGVSTEFIRECLGHSSPETTDKYLAGFEDKEQRKNANKLTKF